MVTKLLQLIADIIQKLLRLFQFKKINKINIENLPSPANRRYQFDDHRESLELHQFLVNGRTTSLPLVRAARAKLL